MLLKKTGTTSFLLLFLFFFGQGQTSNDHTIIYKTPSKDFIDITIQSHKDLPRYGELYFRRGVTPPTNNKAYESLVKMKYLAEIFKDMELGKLTKRNNSGTEDKKSKNSQFAQQHLLGTAAQTASEEVLKKYFCDPEQGNLCQFTNTYGERKIPIGWGGSRNNEFQQMRGYKGYINDHYKNLKGWSNSFFKDNQQQAYYVVRSAISGKYDFKEKGYWVSPSMKGVGSSFLLHSSFFIPYTENEKKIRHGHQPALWSITPDKAKVFQFQNRSPVFLVFKIMVKPKLVNTHVQFDFELEEQIIELYKDIALTQKIGEINIADMKTKY